MLKNEIDLNDILNVDYRTTPSVFDGVFTKTTMFMLPAIGIKQNSPLFSTYFVNAYLDDHEHIHDYQRCIFLLFKTPSFKALNWQVFSKKLKHSDNYVTNYYCGKQDNYELVMYVYKIIDFFIKDFYLFKKGKYSSFSDEYKSRFSKEVNKKSWQIVNKHKSLIEEIAQSLVVKDKEGNIIDNDDYETIYKSLMECDDIWEKPKGEREYYRFKKIEIP